MSHFTKPAAAKSIYLGQNQRQELQSILEQPDLTKVYRRRIKIMLLADEGKSQTEICQQLGCSTATARLWISMAESGLAHQWQEKSIGRPQIVSDRYLQRLQQLVNQSPRDYGYSFHRWTGNWLSKHLAKELGIKISDRYINQLLKKMGLSTRNRPSTLTQPKSSRIDIQDLPIVNPDQNESI